MNTSKTWRIAFIVALAAMSGANATCLFTSLAPVGSTAQVGDQTIQLGDADDAIHPVAWQGPLVVGACTLDVGIIEGPLMMTNAGTLYVPTYSGSVRKLVLVDLHACKVRWQSASFAGKLKISPRALQLGDMRVALDARCEPIKKTMGAGSQDQTPF